MPSRDVASRCSTTTAPSDSSDANETDAPPAASRNAAINSGVTEVCPSGCTRLRAAASSGSSGGRILRTVVNGISYATGPWEKLHVSICFSRHGRTSAERRQIADQVRQLAVKILGLPATPKRPREVTRVTAAKPGSYIYAANRRPKGWQSSRVPGVPSRTHLDDAGGLPCKSWSLGFRRWIPKPAPY